MRRSTISLIVRQRADTCPSTFLNRTLGMLEYKFTFLYRFGAFVRSLLYGPEIEENFFAGLQREYNELVPYLPNVSSPAILDIGAGLGGIDIYLAGHYQNAALYLLDRSESNKTTPGFSPSHGFYNSFDSAREVLTSKGVRKEQGHFLTPEQLHTLPQKVDIVLSLFSCGFHYPISTYQNVFEDCLEGGGTVILDIRKGTGQKEEAQKLGNIFVIRGDDTAERIKITK